MMYSRTGCELVMKIDARLMQALTLYVKVPASSMALTSHPSFANNKRISTYGYIPVKNGKRNAYQLLAYVSKLSLSRRLLSRAEIIER